QTKKCTPSTGRNAFVTEERESGDCRRLGAGLIPCLMNRRTFTKMLGMGVAGMMTGRAGEAGLEIETVKGRIRADELGLTLPHEHVLVDFIGADRVSPDRYAR